MDPSEAVAGPPRRNVDRDGRHGRAMTGSSVYGVGMFRFAIHDIVRKVQQNHDELAILGDGLQVRDYLK